MARPSIWRVFTQPLVIAALVFAGALVVMPFVIGYVLAEALAPLAEALAPAPRPVLIYEPDHIGRPYHGECDEATGVCTMVVGGERITLGPNAIKLTHWGPPNHDELLLVGVEPGLTWYASFPQGWLPNGAPRDCKWVVASEAWDDDDSIVFAFREPGDEHGDVAFRLRKATSWNPPYTGPWPDEEGRYSYSRGYWCLDRNGAVTAVFP